MKSIGNILIDWGVVTSEQLSKAIEHQKRFGGRLASCCLALRLADEKTLARALAHQLGVPFVVLGACALPLELTKIIPRELATKLSAFPIRLDGRQLLVTLSDPLDIAKIDELRFITGMQVIEHGALDGCLADTIRDAYRQAEEERGSFWLGDHFDPSTSLGGAGHIEVVMPDDHPPAERFSLAPQQTQEDPSAWVEELKAATGRTKKKTVLVVDDEPEIRQMLADYLGKVGYEVWMAADGAEAIRILAEKRPAAIVLDAMLPGVHGFDICRQVKGSPATRDMVVVMISAVYRGWRYADDVKRMYGADAFLEKPLRLDQLRNTLAMLLSGTGDSTEGENLNEQVTALLRQAAEAYRRGEIVPAVQLMQKAVELAPFSASLNYRLGLLYEKLGENFRAIASLERAAELDPEKKTLSALARLYEKTGFRAKAYEAWERLLRTTKDEAEAAAIRSRLESLL